MTTVQQKTYVIADIGACHDGKPEKFFKAIDAAKLAGCDAIKFQWTSDPVRMAKRRGRADVDGYALIYRQYLAWSRNFHSVLCDYCDDVGIDYMCTTFLPEDVDVVAPFVSAFKVASFEALDFEFIVAHVPYCVQPNGKVLLVSTGMLSDADVDRLANRNTWPRTTERECQSYWSVPLRLLQCVSSYPCKIEDLNLSLLWRRHDYDPDPAPAESMPTFDGISDHTDPTMTLTGALAVAAGADYVEAHLRLIDTDPKNPDYKHAMAPELFAHYVSGIRIAEQALGTGTKERVADEAKMSEYRVTK